MEEREILSLSENDITPEPGETETPPTEEGQDPAADPETPPEEDEPGENTETPDQGTPAQETGSGQESISKEELQELLDGINARFEHKDADVADLTESIRSLVDLMSVDQYQQRDVYTPPEILIDGYMAWDYPITVDYIISIVGYEEMVPQSAAYDDPEQFLEDFQDMAWNCYLGTVFKDFYIDKAYDAGGNKVYDSQPETEPEPEPGEEEPDETVELLLSQLEDISTTLEEMQQADLEYYQAVYDHQMEMRQINAAEAACTIIICVAVIAIFATLLWSELFRRFK